MRRTRKHPLLGLILAFAPFLTGCAFNEEGGVAQPAANPVVTLAGRVDLATPAAGSPLRLAPGRDAGVVAAENETGSRLALAPVAADGAYSLAVPLAKPERLFLRYASSDQSPVLFSRFVGTVDPAVTPRALRGADLDPKATARALVVRDLLDAAKRGREAALLPALNAPVPADAADLSRRDPADGIFAAAREHNAGDFAARLEALELRVRVVVESAQAGVNAEELLPRGGATAADFEAACGMALERAARDRALAERLRGLDAGGSLVVESAKGQGPGARD